VTLLHTVLQDVHFCFQSHSCTLLHLAIAHVGSKLKFDNRTNLFSLNWGLFITDRCSKSVIILHNTIMFDTGRKLNFILCCILFTSNIKLFVTQLINNRVSHSTVSWHLYLEQQFFIWSFRFVNEMVSLLTWPRAWQVLQYILVHKGFPSNKTAVLRDSVNWTHVVYWPK